MKKLNLSIPIPCHENWDQMTQAEKGKFCGACQKTVVDFTNMTDRQLVEFFKKPKDNVCGRFNNDQLEREITIPRKRIPWLKYFFQFTWPAFMFALKSCTNNTVGKVKGELQMQQSAENKTRISPGTPVEISSRTETIRLTTIGDTVSQITPYEILPPPPELIKCDANITLGIIAMPDASTNTKEDTVDTNEPLEPVTIYTYPVMGKIVRSSVVCEIKSQGQNVDSVIKSVHAATTGKAREEYLAYPNPVQPGSMLTIKFPENNIPKKIELVSVSGQLVTAEELSLIETVTNCYIPIPADLSSGVYFLRMIGEKKILSTTKIVVTK